MDTPPSVRQLIIQLFHEGKTQMDISKLVKVNQSTVSRIIRRFTTTGNAGPTRTGKCGRKRLLSSRTDRLLARQSVINPKATAADIQASSGGEALNVSLSTIKRSLRRSGRLAFRPVKSPSWTLAQMRVRLHWAQEQQFKSVGEWKKVWYLHSLIIHNETFLNISTVCVLG